MEVNFEFQQTNGRRATATYDELRDSQQTENEQESLNNISQYYYKIYLKRLVYGGYRHIAIN